MLREHRIHATLPASDLARARRFYEEKLGFTGGEEQAGGIFLESGGGTRFLIFPSRGAASGQHTQAGWAVKDIHAEVAELRRRGVVFEEYDLPNFKTVGGIYENGPVKSAWFKDSEGNLLGVAQLPE